SAPLTPANRLKFESNRRHQAATKIEILRCAQDFGTRLRRRVNASSSSPTAATRFHARSFAAFSFTQTSWMEEILRCAQDFGTRLRRRVNASSSSPTAATRFSERLRRRRSFAALRISPAGSRSAHARKPAQVRFQPPPPDFRGTRAYKQ